MQDIHAFGGGRIFNAGGGGDRRLRPHNQSHQILKCPRCDSQNTKFCYYNNYNLSQPRHFCKSCRRYWTKGGVLRNVPVGGGCRKAKRAKSKHSSESAAAPTQPQQLQQERDQSKANSHSSSESSSTLTASNSNVGVANTAASSAGGGGAESVSLLNVNESKFLEPGLLEPGSGAGIFSEIGNFTSLINPSSSETMPFGFSSILTQEGIEQGQQWQAAPPQLQPPQMSGGLMDPTVQDELSGLRGRSGGLGPLDWQWSGDQAFDLPNTLDQTYWSQSQWTDQDHPGLYLP